MPKIYAAVIAVILAGGVRLNAQRLTVGAVVGLPLTGDVVTNYTPFIPFPSYTLTDIQSSGNKSVIGGAILEWSFTKNFSVEGNAIYRELNFKDLYAGNHNPTVTIEFPVLAKYRFNFTKVHPFLEAGPAFRTTGNLNSNPSHFGVSAGAGFDVAAGPVTLSPTLRYTRWERDSGSPQSRPDQLELLFGITPTRGISHGFLKHIFFGAVLGTDLLNDVSSQYYGSGFGILPGGRSFLIGPSLEFEVSKSFSVEADGIYRPVRFVYSGPSGPSAAAKNTIWEFPVLAKYKLPVTGRRDWLHPFVEAGITFRTPTGTTLGFGTGAGIECKWKWFHISPELRYTRWQAGRLFDNYKADELGVFLGWSF